MVTCRSFLSPSKYSVNYPERARLAQTHFDIYTYTYYTVEIEMKITTNSPKNNKIKMLVCVIAGSFAVLFLAIIIRHTLPLQNQAPNGPTDKQLEEQQKSESDAKREFIESTKDIDTLGTDPQVPTSPNSIEISATQDAGIVTIASKLHGYSEGTCRLAITNGTTTIEESANIIYQPDFSTCAGFSIVKTRLGKGDWNIQLHITPLGGSEISKEMNYIVK